MRTGLIAFFLLTLFSCVTTRRAEQFFLKKLKTDVETSPVFSKGFTGFHLVDAASGQTLCAVNADRYFTPASNTKILTLAACLELLGDSIPGLQYCETDSGLTFKGTGDPTFLHPKFKAWQHIAGRLIKARQPQLLWVKNCDITPLGPGWAWDDADEYYSAERSCLPVYGNAVRVYAVRSDSLALEPDWGILRRSSPDYNITGNNAVAISGNGSTYSIYYASNARFNPDFELFLPIRRLTEVDQYVEDALLEQALGREVRYAGDMPQKHVWFSTPVDTVYRRMMYESDNFVAEQLLLQASGARVNFQYLQQDSVIRWMTDSVWAGFPTPPRWVDGSGLSRYNLVSPQFLTTLLRQLYREQPRERLFQIFPAGGVSGTIAGWYRGPEGKPCVFAKTGTMSGVHCLSGYLVAKSGRVLVFSFMHNNFIGSSTPWKVEMQRLLLDLWGHY